MKKMAKKENKIVMRNILKYSHRSHCLACCRYVFYKIFPGRGRKPSRSGLIPVELVKTIDGDTIKIKYEGKEQNVRYLLIDTPETNHHSSENSHLVRKQKSVIRVDEQRETRNRI